MQYSEKFLLTKLEQAEKAISEVYKIHIERIEGEHRYCVACDIGSVWGVTYPCATVRAIDPEWNEYE